MTVVVACRFLKHAAVFADCRVSYPPQQPGAPQYIAAVDDNLQKLYQIGEKVVLGLSGPVWGANQVIRAVWKNMEKCPKRYRSAAYLQKAIERWIRYEYRQIRPEHREGLAFILTSVEPTREARSRHKRRLPDGTMEDIPQPKLAMSPELASWVLKPSQSEQGELVKDERGMFQILGLGKEGGEAVRSVLEQFCGFAFKQPGPQARVIVDQLMYTLMKRNDSAVGGLFQYALLGTWGIHWSSYASPTMWGSVAQTVEDGRVVLRNDVTGETVPLLTTWEWCDWYHSHQQPGSSGVFEDPSLRKAVNSLRTSRDGSLASTPDENDE